MTTRRAPNRIRAMVPSDSLAALVDEHLRVIGMTVTDAARLAGLSARQMHRIVKGNSVYVQPATIDGLERLGLDRRRLVLAVYGAESTPQEVVT